MMGSQAEEILNDIETCIISCDNTVTYKWISQKWNVHVNTAKQLLYSFLNKEKSKENPVNYEVVYFVSGPLKTRDNEKSYQVCLVREKNLPDVKSKLEKIVSEHVYSVQKGNIKDLHTLYVVDKADGRSVLQGKSGKGSIKNEEAVPRSFDSLIKSSSSKQFPDNKEDNIKQKDHKSVVKNPPDSSIVCDDNLKNSKDPKSKDGLIVNGKIKKDDHKGIAGMFAAQNGKNSAKKSEKEEESTNTVSKKPETKKNGIATFFAKQAERPPVQKVKKEEPQKRAEPPKKVEPKKKQANGKKAPPEKKSEKQVIEVDDEDPFASEDEEVDKNDLIHEIVSDEGRCESPVEQRRNEKNTKKKVATKGRKNKRPKSFEGEEESPLATKKRRRIKMMSSSEGSSDEDPEKEIGESESPIPQSPKAPPQEEISDDDDIIPATPQESQSGPPSKKRMRRRVLVNRTFSDEQGYIVTKKEFVFESCTDDSNQSGDESKSSKEKDLTNNKLNHAKEAKDDENKANNNKNDSDVEMTSPGDNNKESKGKKGKEPAKGKKAANKKISPSNVRQGVLTSFFKRS